MPRASRRPMHRNLSKELEDNFASLISSLTSSKDIEQFFQDFLTREEKVMLTKRLMLHLMLENGYKTSEIAAVLGISRETIRVHMQVWSRGGETYIHIIKGIAKRRKTKEFWKQIEKLLTPLDLAFRARNDMKARGKLMSGEWLDD